MTMPQAPFFDQSKRVAESVSQWVPGVADFISQSNRRSLPVGLAGDLEYICDGSSVWLVYAVAEDVRIAIRACTSPQGHLSASVEEISQGRAEIIATAPGGEFRVEVTAINGPSAILRCRTKFSPSVKIRLDQGPRDVILLDAHYRPFDEGLVFVEQSGPTSGLVWCAAGGSPGASCLYFQNLSDLVRFAEAAEADLNGCVGVEWPELGLARPAAKKPLEPERAYIISDTFIVAGPGLPADETAVSEHFLDAIGLVYPLLPQPSVAHYDWRNAVPRALQSLEQSDDCRQLIDGVRYVNAYVGSSDKPPESMVQLAVLVPLLDYEKWAGEKTKLVPELLKAIPRFWNEELRTYVRWLPGEPFKVSDSEEESHDILDSWYYLHILLNIGRLCAAGQDQFRDKFLESLEYAIKTGHEFDYEWPVFFRVNTLGIEKAETAPGEGGEFCVSGLYVHVMIQAYELTQNRRYIDEAEAAALHLRGRGFRIFYQSNNTIMAGRALLQLWRITGKTVYRDLSLICAANVVSRMWIWNAKFGKSKAYDTFLGMTPVQDAPYLAAYEEHEFLAAAVTYLREAKEALPPTMNVLIPEFMKHLLHRARYYFCEELPPEIIAAKPKEGFIQRDLFVPLEDLYAGDEEVGQVGQEVYGAAAPFILTTIAYHRHEQMPLILRCDYPVLGMDVSGSKIEGAAKIQLAGADVFECDLLAQQENGLSIDVSVVAANTSDEIPRWETEHGFRFLLRGGGTYRIAWTAA